MKKRSISHRNLLGGFCGGILGILLFSLIHPLISPVGVIIGVVSGYWYQEILVSIKQGWKKTAKKYKMAVSAITKFPDTAVSQIYSKSTIAGKKLFSKSLIIISSICSFFKSLRVVFNRKVVNKIVWIIFNVLTLGIPTWLKKHPINRAYFTRFLAFTSFLCINGFAVYLIITKAGLDNLLQNDYVVKQSVPVSFIICLFTIVLIVFALATMMVGINEISTMSEQTPSGEVDTLTKMRRFYQVWSEFSKKGPILLFLSSFGRMSGTQFWIMTLLSMYVLYGLVVGVIILVFSTIPLFLLLGVAKIAYRFTRRPNHWLCVGITLITTLAFGFLAKDYIASAQTLWIVALATGITSGIATELTRKIMSLMFRGKLENLALTEIIVKINPAWKIFNLGLIKSEKIIMTLRP